MRAVISMLTKVTGYMVLTCGMWIFSSSLLISLTWSSNPERLLFSANSRQTENSSVEVVDIKCCVTYQWFLSSWSHSGYPSPQSLPPFRHTLAKENGKQTTSMHALKSVLKIVLTPARWNQYVPGFPSVSHSDLQAPLWDHQYFAKRNMQGKQLKHNVTHKPCPLTTMAWYMYLCTLQLL